MNPTAPIIAGIDFSAASEAVLRHAVLAAGLTRAPVRAIHVLDSSALEHRAASGAANPTEDLLAKQAERRLLEMIDLNFPAAEIDVEIRSGRPSEELHHAIKESGASLLVIAANDLTKKRLGSIAARCVRTAPCDVLVLRDWQDGKFTKIVVCTDFSKISSRALEDAIDLATRHSASLEIVHVMYPPSRDIWGQALDHTPDISTYVDDCRNHINKRMEKFLAPQKKALAALPHRSVILESTLPAAALTHHVLDSGTDLVVLGTRLQSRLGALFIGTNAERLIHDATVSVLAVRD